MAMSEAKRATWEGSTRNLAIIGLLVLAAGCEVSNSPLVSVLTMGLCFVPVYLVMTLGNRMRVSRPVRQRLQELGFGLPRSGALRPTFTPRFEGTHQGWPAGCDVKLTGEDHPDALYFWVGGDLSGPPLVVAGPGVHPEWSKAALGAHVPQTEVPIGDDDLRTRIRVLCDKPVWARQFVDEGLLLRLDELRLDESPVAPLLMLHNGRVYCSLDETQLSEEAATGALDLAASLAERIREGAKPRDGG